MLKCVWVHGIAAHTGVGLSGVAAWRSPVPPRRRPRIQRCMLTRSVRPPRPPAARPASAGERSVRSRATPHSSRMAPLRAVPMFPAPRACHPASSGQSLDERCPAEEDVSTWHQMRGSVHLVQNKVRSECAPEPGSSPRESLCFDTTLEDPAPLEPVAAQRMVERGLVVWTLTAFVVRVDSGRRSAQCRCAPRASPFPSWRGACGPKADQTPYAPARPLLRRSRERQRRRHATFAPFHSPPGPPRIPCRGRASRRRRPGFCRVGRSG